jgi:signal peptidase II
MQAARGTSLSDTRPTPSTRPSGAPARFRLIFAVVAATAYAVDVMTKVLAVEKLAGGADIELLGSWLVLHLTRNPGAAFSTGTELTLLLSMIAIAAAGVVLYLARRIGTAAWAWALGLLLGGILGNLTDRILREPGPMRGHVVDFLMVPHWPVFNVADICINVAAGLILLQAIRGIGINGTRATAREQEA